MQNKLTEAQQEDIVRKLKDKEWRLKNLYFIIDEKWNKIPFTPNTIQKRIREERKNRKAIILKYRQWGVSTEMIVQLVDDFCFWGYNRNNYFITHRQDLLDVFFKKAKQIYDDISPEVKWILPELTISNANEMYWKRANNTLRISLDVRGKTPTKLHVSEFAFKSPEEQLDLFTAMNEFRECEITIETTANGVWDTTYLLVNEAKHGLGEYQLMFYPWHIEDRNEIDVTDFTPTEEENNIYENYLKPYGWDKAMRKLAWRRIKIQTNNAMGEDWIKRFHQENPITIEEAFISSWSMVFDLDRKDTWKRQTDYIEEEWIRFYTDKGKDLSIGIDIAEWWIKWDFSSITSYLPSGKIAFQYKWRVNEVILAKKLDYIFSKKLDWIQCYSGYIIPENNVWLAFINECKQYWWFKYTVKQQNDDNADDYNEWVQQKYGFRTTKTSKDLYHSRISISNIQ